MKAKLSSVLCKKIVVAMFGVALILFGICFAGNDVSKVYAVSELDTTTYADYAFKTYTGTEAKEYVGLKAPNAEEGYAFAGWYTKATCKLEEAVKSNASVENSDSATYYAKFVPEDVLSIRVQVSTKEDVNESVDGNQRNMRVVSSVDTLNYLQVGFRLKYKEDNIESNPWIYKRNTAEIVYERIESATEGDEYKFSPKVVDTKSQYFMTATWKGDDNTGISESDFDTNYYIRAYWVTLDGMTVYGPTRYVSVNDGLVTDIVNVPVKDNGETATWSKGETVDVTYTKGENTVPTQATVAYHDGTYAHLRVDLDTTSISGVNKSEVLDSLTKFTIDDKTMLYRNLYTKYTEDATAGTNTADTTWYNLCTGNEYVIATSADLYGLSKMTLPSNGLSGKKIYVVADIEANKGRATESGWDSEQTSDGQTITDGSGTAYEWTPIGGSIQFKGTFDGQGHSISGIYINSKATVNTGLFASGNVTTTIKNLELINSFYSTSASRAGGFIGYGSGTYKSLRSAVILKTSAGNAGGIIGQVNVDTAYLDDCCFDGTLIATAGNGYGGMIGYSGNHVTIQNCLNKGTMNIATTCNRIGGFIGRAATAKTYQISNCLMATTIAGTTNRGTVIGNVENADGLVKLSNVYAIQDTEISSQATVEIGSNTSTNEENSISYSLVEKTEIQGYDPWYYDNTSLDFENYWCLVDGTTPELKSFADKDKVLTTLTGKGTEASPWIISTREEMLAFVDMSYEYDFSEKYVSIGTEEQKGKVTIVINEGETVDDVKENALAEGDAGNWLPIGSTDMPFAGTFNGNGNTISGVYLETSTPYGGLFAAVATAEGAEAEATIKNLNLVNSYFEFNGSGNAYIGSIAGSVKGNLYAVSSNATVHSSGLYNAGLVGEMASGGTLDSCWFKGRVELETDKCQYGAGLIGIVGAGTGATVYMQHCLNSGTIAGERTDTTILGLSGLCSYVYSGNLAISDSLHVGTIEGTGTRRVYLVARGETLVSCENTYYSNDQELDHAIWGDKCTKDNGTTGLSQSSMIGLAAELNGVELNDTYWAFVKGNTPQLKCYGMETNVELWSGEGTKASPWIISTADELTLLADTAKGYNFNGKYFKLGNSITVDSDNWTPIGTEANAFAGNFDGNNKTISGINYQGDGTYIGLFGHVGATGSVSNLTLANSSFSTTNTGVANIGAIVGRATGGTYTKIKVDKDVIVESTGVCNGGIAGSAWGGNATFSNCWFAGTLEMSGETGRQGGAIVGRAYGGGRTITIEHCLNTGNISSATTQESKTPIVGGLCGHLKDATLKISDSLNANCVESQYTYDGYVGAIIGWAESGTYELKQVYGIDEVKDDSEEYYNHPVVGTDNGTMSTDSVDYEVVADTKMIGDEAWLNLNLNFDEYWNAVQDSMPELQCFPSGIATLVVWDGEGTEQSPWIIDSADKLRRLATLSATYDFAGKHLALGTTKDAGDLTIKVNDASSVTELEAANPTNWTPIGSESNPFAGTFDGRGNTISGIYYKGNAKNIGLFGYVSGSGVIRNLGLTISSFENTTSTANTAVNLGSIVGHNAGTLERVKSDATIKSGGRYNGGLVGEQVSGSISHCWYDGAMTLYTNGQFSGGIVGRVLTGTIEMKHCLFSKTISGSDAGVRGFGGLVGIVDSGTLKIDDSLVSGSVTTGGGNQYGSFIGRLGNGALEISNTYTKNVIGSSYVIRRLNSGTGTIKYNGTVLDVSGTYKEGVKLANYTEALPEANLKGNNAFNTKLDFVNHWQVVEEGMPVLQSPINSAGVVQLAGEGTQTSPYIITNKVELERLATIAQTYNFSGKYIQLGTDEQEGKLTITVNEGTIEQIKESNPKNWTPIGTASNLFAGNFNGNGNTISGLYYKGDGTYVGLFAITGNTAEVKDLKIANSYFESSATGNVFIGSVAGVGYGAFENIKSEAEVACYGQYIGGLVGSVWRYGSATFNNCWFDGKLRVEGASAEKCGGILGGLNTLGDYKVDINNCLNSGTINISSLGDEKVRVGGICGFAQGVANITNCLNATSFTTTRARVAAIVGDAYYGSVLTLQNVYAIAGDGADGTYNSSDYCGHICEAEGNNEAATVTLVDNSWAKLTAEQLAGTSAETYVSALFTIENSPWIAGDLYPVLNILGETGMSIPAMTVASAESRTETTLTGDGNFVKQITATTRTEYENYLTALETAGFEKYAYNVDDENCAITSTVLCGTYAKDNLILNATYFVNEGRTSISYYEGALSEHLISVDTTEDAGYETTLSMLEMFHYGNSFVIQLKNGHFIISDGGLGDELIYLIEYLEKLVGKDSDDNQIVPVIEAWFITHAHGDHTGALNSFWNAGKRELVNRVSVEGVYYSSPSDAEVLRITGCETVDHGISKVVKTLLRTQAGEPTPLYRPQTGQRYYFNNEVTIDIMLAQEQLEMNSDETTDVGAMRANLNSSSTVSLVTINGQTCLLPGDLQEAGFDILFANYDATLFSTLDFFALNHHGFNTNNKIAEKVTAKTILKTVKDTTPIRCETAIKRLCGKATESVAWGDGTVVFTFPYTPNPTQPTYDLLTSNLWAWKDSTEPKYHENSERMEQPNLNLGTDGVTDEEFE